MFVRFQFEVRLQLELVGWLNGGSNVMIFVDWGEGQTAAQPCSNASDLEVFIVSMVFQTLGTYEITVLARNDLSEAKATANITVYERIVDLMLSGDTSVRFPSGIGNWIVDAGPDQRPLEHIVCVWDMGPNHQLQSYDVAQLDAVSDHEVSFFFDAGDAGTTTVSVNCHNPASSQRVGRNGGGDMPCRGHSLGHFGVNQ